LLLLLVSHHLLLPLLIEVVLHICLHLHLLCLHRHVHVHSGKLLRSHILTSMWLDHPRQALLLLCLLHLLLHLSMSNHLLLLGWHLAKLQHLVVLLLLLKHRVGLAGAEMSHRMRILHGA